MVRKFQKKEALDKRKIKYELDARSMYEVQKSISNIRTITNSIIDSMVITMFIDYLRTFDDPEGTVVLTFDGWKEAMLQDKKEEIEALQEDNETLTDLAVVNSIVTNEHYDNYAKDLNDVFGDIIGLILSQLSKEEDE